MINLRKYLRKIGIGLGILILILIGIFSILKIVFIVSPSARQYASNLLVRYYSYSLEQAIKHDYELATKDKVGGKTPQETLRMYISLVDEKKYKEAGELFVLDKQKNEKKILQRMDQKKIQNIQLLLKQAVASSGSFSYDQKQYFIQAPIYVHLVIYPSGNWKIVEI